MGTFDRYQKTLSVIRGFYLLYTASVPDRSCGVQILYQALLHHTKHKLYDYILIFVSRLCCPGPVRES